MTDLQSHLSAYLALGVGVLSLGFAAIFVRWANAIEITTRFDRLPICRAGIV